MAVGKIEPFNLEMDNWGLYIDRLEQYFIINDVEEKLKVPTLITVMGGKSYELLVTLCAPKKPSSFSFQEISKIMSKHLQPKPSMLAERFKFRQRVQASEESLANYVAALRGMAMSCGFSNNLNENMRDQFVCGIRCEQTRQKLFAEDDIDFHTALKRAQAWESAEKNAAVITGNTFNLNSVTNMDDKLYKDTYEGARGRYIHGRVQRPHTEGASGTRRNVGANTTAAERGGGRGSIAQRARRCGHRHTLITRLHRRRCKMFVFSVEFAVRGMTQNYADLKVMCAGFVTKKGT